MGTIDLLSGFNDFIQGPFLIVATQKQRVGHLPNDHALYKLVGFDLIPFIESTTHLNEIQKRDQDHFISLIRNILSTDGFYFSYTYDLTRNLQKQSSVPTNSQNLLANIERSFCYNYNLLSSLASKATQPIDSFLLPIIQGFVGQEETFVCGRRINFCVISRRNWHRTGTRYHSRGVDRNGNVSNFVETEQIVALDNNVTSFVQVRGSVPVFWNQQINIRYQPHLAVENHSVQYPLIVG